MEMSSKIKNKISNRTFLKIFVLFIGSIFIVEILLFVYSYQNDMKILLDRNREMDREVIENVVEYLQTLVNDEIILNETVADTTWSVMLGIESDVFNEKLTYDNLQQLTEDFLFYVPIGSVLDSRSVLFLKNDFMLTRSRYGKLNYFLKMKGIPLKYQDDILDCIAAADNLTKIDCFDENGNNLLGNKIMLAAPLSKRQNEYTVTLIDLKKLKKAILPMLSDRFAEVRIYDCDTNEIFFLIEEEARPSEKNIQREVVQIKGINWSVEFVINDVVFSVSEMFLENQVIYVTMIILTTIIAMFLTIYIYAPIKRISNKFSGALVGKDLYQAIDHSVDKIVSELKASRRQDFLHQLLIGYFEDSYEENEKDFPMQNNTWVKVMVIPKQKKGQNIRLYEELERYKCLLAEKDTICLMMQSVNGHYILLLGHESHAELKKVSTEIVNSQSEKDIEIFVGTTEKGFLGISKSYQAANEKMQFVNGVTQPRYYFPMEWKMQWITALRNGKRKVVEEILQEVFSENHRRLENGEIEKSDFYHLFRRIFEDMRICIKEVGIDEDILKIEKIYMFMSSDEDSQEYTEMNELLHIENEFILLEGALCNKIIKRMDFNTNYNRKIIGYIEEHLSNPEMSVVLLEDVFNISANTINKTIKYYTGKTFVTYLTYCRMERAKELLLQDIKISDVAIQVGYENEYSFRRVFQRYSGIKVQNFKKEMN